MQPHSTRKMATRKPENIHESDRDFAGPLGEINPDIPYPCEEGISGPERAVLLFLSLFFCLPTKLLSCCDFFLLLLLFDEEKKRTFCLFVFLSKLTC